MKRTSLILIAILLIPASFLISQSKLDKIKDLINQKQYSEAITACQNYLQSNARDEDGWLLLAKAYQQSGNLDSAEEAAKKAIDLEDELMEGYAILANVKLLKNQPLDAIAIARAGLKKTKKKQTEYPPLLIELAWSLLKADSIDAAQVAAAKAKELDPNNPIPYEIIGDAYAKQKVSPMAISSYEKSLELDSMQLRVLYKLATTFKNERQYTSAALIYTRILNLDSKNDEARLELARLFFRAKQYVKCSQTLQVYFETHKNPPEDVHQIYLEALFVSKQYSLAFEAAKEFLKTQPTSGLANRAYAYGFIVDKKYPQAIEALNKLATVDTMNYDDYRWLGLAYRQVKKDSLAAITYEEALKDTTQSFANRSYLLGEVGSIWMKYNDWERAASFYEKRAQIDTTAIGVGAYLNYGQCMMQLGKFESAILAFKKVVKGIPKYPLGYLNLSICYSIMEDNDASRKEAENTIKVIDTAETKFRVELAQANRIIAVCIMQEKRTTIEGSQKKWEEAITYLKKALKIKEDDAGTHFRMGMCFQNLNKVNDAIKEYKRTLQLDPKNKEAQKYLSDLLKLKP